MNKLLALAVPGLLLASASYAFPQEWKQTGAPNTNWSAIAVSADGTRIVAVGGGLVYRSTDSGTNWFPTTAPSNGWFRIASSADGSRLIAAARGILFTSADSGATWSPRETPTNNWTGVATSADRHKLVAVAYNGAIYTSTNAGVNWASNSLPRLFACVASSADGTKLFAGEDSGESIIFISKNSGRSWDFGSYAPVLWGAFHSIASSADGKKLAIGGPTASYNHCDEPVPLCSSDDGGITWLATPASAPTCMGWQAVASSSDGTRLIGVAQQGLLFVSTNSGITWTSNHLSESSWSAGSAAVSADGNRIFVAITSGSTLFQSGIYTWQTTLRPELKVIASVSSLLISWIVPSMPFVLQENADLTTTNWTDVITTSILNLTNLHHEVSVPLSSTNRFYRLQSL